MVNNIINLKHQQMTPAVNHHKNIACVFLGALFVSISAVVMSQIYYSQEISHRIQTVSQLTEYPLSYRSIKYPTWGQQPNPTNSLYLQTFQLYNLQLIDSRIQSSRSEANTTFDFRYEYLNTSFQQGDSGRLDFINKWELVERPPQNVETGAITTLNLGADKIYNYDHYAPPQRKITILYNELLDILTSNFLERFYSTYLFEYFFKDEKLVLETVFKPLKFDEATSKAIYEDEIFGWNSPDKLRNWAVMSLKGEEYSKATRFYEQLLTDLKLSPKQVSQLVFEKSTLDNMISALNGTIATKAMQAKSFRYKCDGFCSNEELAAFQISSAFLTKDPLFASLGLDMKSKDLNATFFADIEYTTFCEANPDLQCLPDQTKAAFFTQHHLGDFEKVNLLWKNQNRLEQIQSIFQLPEGTGKSVIEYVKFVYASYVQKYDKFMAWGQTTHDNLQSSVNKYYELLLVQLFARGFHSKFLSGAQKNACSDYFSKETAAIICQKGSEWNLDEGLPVARNYFKAFFFFENMREQFKNASQFSDEEIVGFFYGIENQGSLFAEQIMQIQTIYSGNFDCKDSQNNSTCSAEELFCMQWGSGKIFDNLPEEIFNPKAKNINDWDENKILNGFNPDYYVVTGEKVSMNKCKEILSSNSKSGIFSWFNLITLAAENKEPKLLKYIASSVVNINLQGLLFKTNAKSLLSGYNSTVVDGKKNMEVRQGGAPWMDNHITLVKTNNQAEIKNNQLLETPQFDTINTGIYNSEKTREITHIWGETKSSSKYVVYKGTKTDDEGKEVPVDIFEQYVTDRHIAGTNLFGFHPSIEAGENLQIYLTQAYQPFTLVFDKEVSSYRSQNIKAYQYKISDGGQPQSFIGIEELNQNSFKLNPESYFIIEPFSGISLQFSVSYSVKSNPLSAQFLIDPNSDSVTLYDSNIFYTRKGLNEFVEISSMSADQHKFLVVGCITAGACLVLGIGFVIASRRKRKVVEKQTLLDSSTSEQ